MVALARKTLLHEWRRFLPAIVAVGFAGLLQLLQAALVLGIFGTAAVAVTGSSADIWVGYPGTQSVNLGRAIDPNIEARLWMDTAVARVEPFFSLDGDWRGSARDGSESVFVSGIDTRPDGLMFAHVLPPGLRARLDEPDAVIVDRADIDKLGVAVGGTAAINGHTVRVVGVSSGLRALGGVNVVSSLATARQLDADPEDGGRPTYFVAGLRDPADAGAVARRLDTDAAFGRYEAWTASAFARRSALYWLFDTGAGAGVLFLAATVFLAGAIITSQTLVAAIGGSVREYATLNALGIGASALRRIVLEQAFWVGALGMLGAGALGSALLGLARTLDVPVTLDLPTAVACAVLVMVLAAASGLAAIRVLRQADPVSLLR
ncbi:ABC transporter permease [Luteibacter yeojuensis]|uniref:ABC transporter permease n=1 Tax=Luteibacter yeojuensis TaxID=345309 RepID=A0A7X5QXD1_9GAMM|nr:ABC transporter permease [Luteibacter yeojuensis]NID17168.1 ABC transporter permease [Luteibacter yeojuensis]